MSRKLCRMGKKIKMESQKENIKNIRKSIQEVQHLTNRHSKKNREGKRRKLLKKYYYKHS